MTSAPRLQEIKTALPTEETVAVSPLNKDRSINRMLFGDGESTAYKENGELALEPDERKSLNENDILAEPPDGGWGWMIVFSSFLVHVITDGVLYSFGIFYVEFLDYYKGSKGETAWVGSLITGFQLFSGPLASILTNKFGCRSPTIIGAVVAALGFVLSIFSPNLYFLYFSFGTLSGIGIGLTYLPAIVSVGHYFDKKRTFAVGLASCGSGIGAFILNPVSKYLIDVYAWRGAILIQAGILLNCVLCGALFRPLKHQRSSTAIRATKRLQVKKEDIATCSDELDKQSGVNQALLDSSAVHLPTRRNTNEGEIELFCSNEVLHFRKKDKESRLLSDESAVPNPQRFSMRKILDLSLFQDVMFIVYLVSNVLFSLCIGVPFTFLYARAVDQGIDKQSAKWLGSILGITNMIGRVLGGLLVDKLKMNRLLLFNITIFVCGILTALCPLCFNYTLLVVFSCVFGLFFGMYMPLMPVVLVDLLGIQMLTNSFGLLLMFKGMANVIGPPIAGWLYDGTGSYDLPFIAAGTIMTASGILLYSASWIKRCRENNACEVQEPS